MEECHGIADGSRSIPWRSRRLDKLQVLKKVFTENIKIFTKVDASI